MPKTEKKLLTATDVLESNNFSYVDVDCRPVFDGDIRIRALSARAAFEFTKMKDKSDAMVRLVIKCAVDEDGNRLFTDNQLEKLKEKDFAVFQRIQRAALSLNSIGEEEKNDLSETS